MGLSKKLILMDNIENMKRIIFLNPDVYWREKTCSCDSGSEQFCG